MLKDLKINNTSKTPEINFDLTSGVFLISGISVPENSMEFYGEIINWLKEYVKTPNDNAKVVFKLTYVNTSSLQFIYDALIILNDAHNNPTKLSVDWYYLNDDDDMREMGEDFRDAVELPFTLIELVNV